MKKHTQKYSAILKANTSKRRQKTSKGRQFAFSFSQTKNALQIKIHKAFSFF